MSRRSVRYWPRASIRPKGESKQLFDLVAALKPTADAVLVLWLQSQIDRARVYPFV
jgi:hypothetical protein